MDTGDYIVVVNAEKLRVTGDKASRRCITATPLIPAESTAQLSPSCTARFPGRVLEKAVKGMLPKGPLGYAMLKKLKVYAGSDHPHSAQQPQTLNV